MRLSCGRVLDSICEYLTLAVRVRETLTNAARNQERCVASRTLLQTTTSRESAHVLVHTRVWVMDELSHHAFLFLEVARSTEHGITVVNAATIASCVN